VKRYDVIYADPAWEYKSKKSGGSMTSGAAQQYPVMRLDDIQALPVRELAAKDAALFLWGTVPMLPEAMGTMAAWGFTYKTALFWDKQRFGTGYWFRGQVEYLLFGIRGKVPAFRTSERNLYSERSERHSAKPDRYRQIIEAAWPGAVRLEMFSRRPASAAWDVWGNEAEGSIDLTQYARR